MFKKSRMYPSNHAERLKQLKTFNPPKEKKDKCDGSDNVERRRLAVGENQ
jgi:hypothetical protein